MRNTVTLPKIEYERLRKIAERYELLRNAVTQDFFEEPPIRDSKEIIAALRKTGRYATRFLNSVARGLNESSFLRSARAK